MMARRVYLATLHSATPDLRVGLYVYERCDEKGGVSLRKKLQTKTLLRWS